MRDKLFLKKLGKRIAEERKKHGWTQEKFAELSGIERSSLARIESGGVNSTINKLRQIAKALDIEIGELVTL
ncbi:MAG: helix-turn-helix transcriptional regulator [Flavobacteriales bacterium]|nr:helix-turn-helix transcriptional regulator [Flavobacteriales bacterium]